MVGHRQVPRQWIQRSQFGPLGRLLVPATRYNYVQQVCLPTVLYLILFFNSSLNVQPADNIAFHRRLFVCITSRVKYSPRGRSEDVMYAAFRRSPALFHGEYFPML